MSILYHFKWYWNISHMFMCWSSFMSNFFIYKLSKPFQSESGVHIVYCRSDLHNSFVQMSILYQFNLNWNVSYMFMCRSSYTCHTSLFINCRNGFIESGFILPLRWRRKKRWVRIAGDPDDKRNARGWVDCGPPWSGRWINIGSILTHTYSHATPLLRPLPVQHYAGNACKPPPFPLHAPHTFSRVIPSRRHW
jgi:hypothetical protein